MLISVILEFSHVLNVKLNIARNFFCKTSSRWGQRADGGGKASHRRGVHDSGWIYFPPLMKIVKNFVCGKFNAV